MSDVKNIVVFISGNGSNLQAMIDSQQAGRMAGNIVKVVSNNAGAYGLERARQADIATEVIDHRDYPDRAEYDAKLADAVDACQADLIVLAGFMRILTDDFVNRYLGRMLNIHPSLLPKYKGLNTHQRAIDAKDPEHGASVHFVTPALDDGPVIIQSKVPVFDDDNAQELAARVQEQERNIYPLVVSWFCSGRLSMLNNKAIMDDNELPATGYAAD